MTPAEITAVVVTRGDRDIRRVVETLDAFNEVMVFDNSKLAKDMMVFGRYLGARGAQNKYVYLQDDDCLVDSAALVEQYQPDEILVNMPANRRQEYAGTGICLLGWGTITPRSSVEVFEDYFKTHLADELFLRECDRVFAYMQRSKIRLTEVRMEHLPYAYGTDRMGLESRHRTDFLKIRERLALLPQ